MRYSPGSLVVIVSASPRDRDRFVDRVFEEKGAVLGLEKLKKMVAGKVDESPRRHGQAAPRRDDHQAHREGRGRRPADRVARPRRARAYVRLAHKFRRPRHLILIETAKDNVAEEDARS